MAKDKIHSIRFPRFGLLSAPCVFGHSLLFGNKNIPLPESSGGEDHRISAEEAESAPIIS
jgi:hypothetical protein